ncbi:MAG: guanylate kinase [Magnetococcales bacterium]|nr:guanylate kinase [Magnetococcales bacterium]
MGSAQSGFILILSAPSGAGKSTLARHLVSQDPSVRFSISTTTRECRPQETNGVDYFFVSRSEFEQQRHQGNFIEWAEVFGHCYGTTRQFVEQSIAHGDIVLLDIDWQGARQVRAQLPANHVVSVMILPPSYPILRQRLLQRGRDSLSVVEQRMAQAEAEASHWGEYDYVLINNQLERAQQDLVAVVRSERLRIQRMEHQIREIVG